MKTSYSHFKKNSRELKERVKNWRIDKNEVIINYDVPIDSDRQSPKVGKKVVEEK